MLIVIAIIGILASVAIPQYSQYKIRGYDAQTKQALKNMHLLCNAYWLDTSNLQGCDLPKIKEPTYGFNQNADVVATLPPSPRDNFCASAKHNDSPNTFSIDSASLISNNEDCGVALATELAEKAEAERIAEAELARKEAESRECVDLMFYDQYKGQEINGQFYKGNITDEFGGLPGAEGTPGFLGTLKKNRGLAFIQRSGSTGLAFWLGCRGLHDANGSVSYAKKQTKHSNMLEIGGGQQWLTGTAHYSSSAFYTGEDLESAAYLNYGARKHVSAECLQQQYECEAIARTNHFGSKTDSFLESNCADLMSSSCSIEPKGILNTPGATCEGRFDCSEKYDLTPACAGHLNAVPGCEGFR
jgi:type IV pilus assembly protein PilA